MLVGRWARATPPIPGELLTSCIARNARAHGLSPYRFLALFRQGDPAWERDFDRDPAALTRSGPRRGGPDWLADLAALIGCARADLERATLLPERRVLGGSGLPARGDTPLLLSAGVHHRTRTRHALQFCPACLAEEPVHFRKAWRLGFAVACEVHGTVLSDGCPHCDAPVVPHRARTRQLTGCQACGKFITTADGGPPGTAAPGAVGLQRRMTAALADAQEWPPWSGREVFDAVRALLAVSTAPTVRERLRSRFGAGAVDRAVRRIRFEHARLEVRTPWLDTVAAWLGDWPLSFREGADAAGLTRRSFARGRLPPPLAAEVASLPVGITRDRTWVPVLDEPVLRRLRRTDKAAYSAVRAERIIAAAAAE